METFATILNWYGYVAIAVGVAYIIGRLFWPNVIR